MVVPLTLEEYCIKPKARPPPDPVDITDFYDDDYLDDDDDDDDSCDDGESGDGCWCDDGGGFRRMMSRAILLS